MKVEFQAFADLRKAYTDEEGEWYIDAYASTTDLDLQNDIVSQEAIDMSAPDLEENSTILENHDDSKRLGRVLISKAIKGAIKLKILISKTAAEAWKQIQEGVLNKLSIRGDIIEAKSIWIDELKQSVRVILKMRLIEASLVSVPANPNAKVLRWYIEKSLDEWVEKGNKIPVMDRIEYENLLQKGGKDLSDTIKTVFSNHAEKNLELAKELAEDMKKEGDKQEDLSKTITDAETLMEFLSALHSQTWDSVDKLILTQTISFLETQKQSKGKKSLDKSASPGDTEEELLKGAIPYKKYPLADIGTAWSGSVETKAADVKDLKQMCAWYDSEDAETKSAYKLPHHTAEGYNTVWKGVSAAMAALFGARGGVDIPAVDKKKVYNHLSKHYAEFEKEPPEFGKSLEDLLGAYGLLKAEYGLGAIYEDFYIKTLVPETKDFVEKKGAKISATNKDKINAAITALQELIKEEEEDSEKKTEKSLPGETLEEKTKTEPQTEEKKSDESEEISDEDLEKAIGAVNGVITLITKEYVKKEEVKS